jgi:hypothetical protein
MYGTRVGLTKVEVATNLYIGISQIWRLNVSNAVKYEYGVSIHHALQCFPLYQTPRSPPR